MQNMIRTFRLENGWTQQILANRVGISRLMISLFEHWRRDPSLALAYRLADALGKRIDEVFPHERQAFRAGRAKGNGIRTRNLFERSHPANPKPSPHFPRFQTLVPKGIGGTRRRCHGNDQRHRARFLETQSRARLRHLRSARPERHGSLPARCFSQAHATWTFHLRGIGFDGKGCVERRRSPRVPAGGGRPNKSRSPVERRGGLK